MFKTIAIADLLNQPEKQIDFVIDKLQDMLEPENISFPHLHDFYEVLWITNGKSKQQIDYNNYTIADNNLFFISPGQLHLFEEWENVEGYVILFTESFFLQIFQNKNILFELSYLDNLHQNPFLRLSEKDGQNLMPIIDLLSNEYKSESPSNEVLQALILVFLRRIQKLTTSENLQDNSKHHIVVFKKFKKLVDIHFNKNLPISQYASLLNISTAQLNKVVKSITTQSTSDIIKERIVLEARQLLQFSDLSVGEIAHQLGFEDSSYFARYFKKQMNVSPQEFRKNQS